jgi:hypothetical protein
MMSAEPLNAAKLINPDALRREVQSLLDVRRGEPCGQLNVARVWFEEGHWRVVIRPTSGTIEAGDYAMTLAEVEEQIADNFGVNVILIPADA